MTVQPDDAAWLPALELHGPVAPDELAAWRLDVFSDPSIALPYSDAIGPHRSSQPARSARRSAEKDDLRPGHAGIQRVAGSS